MLCELRIANFALIEELHLQFQPGFTVLTGETGAGKSLLIDAVALLVGGRASIEQIRTGEDEAQLEAAFQLPDTHPVIAHLRAEGVLGPTESDLILKRVLSRSGRHRAYLNGSLCPLRILEALGGTLVDIHGQHEQQSLLSQAKQIEALDAFGMLDDLRGRYESAYRAWIDTAARLEGLKNAGGDRDRLAELLRYQVEDIERARLQIGEEKQLQTERDRLVHAHRLRELAEEVYRDLQADDLGVLVQLGRAERRLTALGQIDPGMQDCRQQAHDASVQLKDLAGRLRDYADALETDPDRQSAVEGRLDLIQRLKKKYGETIDLVLHKAVCAREELSGLENRDSRIEDLTKLVQDRAAEVTALARQLSKKRRDAAKQLKTRVTGELAAVRMEGTVFDVSVTAGNGLEHCGPGGYDRVDFLLTGNVGEPPRLLSRIASGGELSRIMLALKTVLAERDRVPVLMFDEIDTGVGGATAAAMGIRLKTLGAFHQVFCITHLPQVASQAMHHLAIEKGQDNQRTSISAKALNGVGREEEIARMLGGVTVTKKVRETAAELIAGAKDKR